MSEQAAGKTVDRLLALGYAERTDDPGDARRKLVRLTAHGRDALDRSAVVFGELRAEWGAAPGAKRVRDRGRPAERRPCGDRVPPRRHEPARRFLNGRPGRSARRVETPAPPARLRRYFSTV
ncbi:hypothetical protein [Streptomyces sp. URMC 124]|uniref:hypothetical protein n=1 Tax=Streptomyces sp. URMC 124 TaxID=3423405 RepID=UPI003F1C72ED